MGSKSRFTIFFAPAMILLLTLSLSRADWPAYRRDIQGSAVTTESLVFPLQLAWRYTSAQPPSPAWPGPVTVGQNLLEFDFAPQPVAAGGLVYLGSSSDDTLRALDGRTGAVRWQFTSGGPIRFAPQVYANRVYLASDDGYVYCLDAADGRLVWKFRAALDDDRLMGDGRLISRWPLRNGLVVDDGVVYTVAGMWPREGIFVYALDAATGDVRWVNDTTGAMTVYDVGGFSESGTWGRGSIFLGRWTGVSPQGILFAGPTRLVVPMGRSAPALFDRQTGKIQSFNPSTKQTFTTGPPFAMVGDSHWNYNHGGGTDELDRKVTGRRGLNLHAAGGGNRFRDVVQPSGEGNPGSYPAPRWLRPHGLDVALLVTEDRFYARRGYSIALAGDILVVGKRDAVVAYEVDPPESGGSPARFDRMPHREIWRAEVDGQARGLAIADGRLIVTTHRGKVYGFAPDADAVVEHQPAAGLPALPEPNAAVRTAIDLIESARMDQGYALVVGDPGPDYPASALAAETGLRVVSVVSDEALARQLRERLLDRTAWYGSRIHVLTASADGRLPFAKHFANAVIVVGDADWVAPAESYRLLRPSGGVMLTVGRSPADALALLEASGLSPSEIHETPVPHGVRGHLPGAWVGAESEVRTDRHLRGPLRPLWFGGPAPIESASRSSANVATATAHGRFFNLVRGRLIAVDGYNGAELWRRDAPTPIGGLSADADHVYLRMDRGADDGGEAVIKLDAFTGEQQAFYGDMTPPPALPLDRSRNWTLELDDRHRGRIEMATTPDGLWLNLTGDGAKADAADIIWHLFFDFRPADERYGLYGTGTFQVRIVSATAEGTSPEWRLERGALGPELQVTRQGAATRVHLSWESIASLFGQLPKTFGFNAALHHKSLELEDDDDPPALGGADVFLSGDRKAWFMNNGWPTIVLENAPDELAALQAPAVVAGPVADITGAIPPSPANYGPDGDTVTRYRMHPLTGDLGPSMYIRSVGCGRGGSSAFQMYARISNVGLMDLEDDSGIRLFGGVRPDCGVRNMQVGGGVMWVGNESIGCACLFAFNVSFALAEAEKPLHEDWALYYDTPVSESRLRLGSFNLAAPGDRRDAERTLWLGYPRQYETGHGVWWHMPGLTSLSSSQTLRTAERYLNGWHLRSSPRMPLDIKTLEDMTPFRVNADRVAIGNTDRPWIYTSKIRGLTNLTIQVDGFHEPLVSQRIDTPPEMTGRLDDPAWTGEPRHELRSSQTALFLRYDDNALYIAAHTPMGFNRRGEPDGWVIADGEAPVWDEDSIEVFLGDAREQQMVHLGAGASGQRYAALAVERPDLDTMDETHWQCAVRADNEVFFVEMAIPFETLRRAGLDLDTLGINVSRNAESDSRAQSARLDVGPTQAEAIRYLGGRGREHLSGVNLAPLQRDRPPAPVERRYAVRLHFAELQDVAPGERVFDVKIQGETVLERFDVAREAGGARTALVREFHDIPTTEAIRIEMIPAVSSPTAETAPILNAIELRETDFTMTATEL